MGILNRLLGKTPAKSRDGGISVYAMLTEMGIKMSPQQCAIDGGTFSCPPNIPNLNGADGMTIDIGGYCPSCRTYCCPKHVQYKRSGYLSGDLTCAQCSTVLTGGPRLDDETDSDLIRIVVD